MHKTSILIVDDDPKIRQLLNANLVKRNYAVREAANGEQAIASLAQAVPDLAILDLGMPGLSGIDICLWIREQGLDMPIIMLSVYAEEAHKVRALDAGADDYVTKPFKTEEFLARLRALLRRTRNSEILSDETFSEARTIPQVAEVAMNQALTVSGASVGSMMLLTDDHTTLQVVNAVGRRPEALEIGQRVPLNSRMPIAEAARTAQPVWLNAGETHDPLGATHEEPAAWAAVPLIINGQTLGGMELGFSEAQAFSKEDKVLIVRLARKYALAIDRARLYDAERLARRQAEQIEERLAFLAQINTALTTVRGYESQLESVARCIVPYLADWCLIDVLEENDSIFSAADAARDSTKQALLTEMHRRYPPNL
jgi:DNA-binding response OmpR family regulator